MFRRLRLWARLVACNEQERGIHDSSTVEHGRHENIMTGTVDERNVAHELPGATFVGKCVGMIRAARRVAARAARAVGALQAINLCVGIPELDCDIALKLVLETDRLDA